jgi:hypothetical protein
VFHGREITVTSWSVEFVTRYPTVTRFSSVLRLPFAHLAETPGLTGSRLRDPASLDLAHEDSSMSAHAAITMADLADQVAAPTVAPLIMSGHRGGQATATKSMMSVLSLLGQDRPVRTEDALDR